MISGREEIFAESALTLVRFGVNKKGQKKPLVNRPSGESLYRSQAISKELHYHNT